MSKASVNLEPIQTENKILFDWLSFSSAGHNENSIFDFLGLIDNKDRFLNLYGIDGYADRLFFNDLSVCYNHKTNKGVFVNMSGQGCRAYESLSTCGGFEELFNYFFTSSSEFHVSRLDVAYDDFTGLLDLDTLFHEALKQNFVSKARKWHVEAGSDGMSVYFGSRKSDIMIRIYDKALERGYTDGRHWVRCELQLKDDHASGFINEYIQSGYDIGACFFGVLNNYLRYVEPSDGDSNKRRWEKAGYWLKFIELVPAIHLVSYPRLEYNIHNLKNYLFGQCAGALKTGLEVFGADELAVMAFQNDNELNPKYQSLISDKNKIRSLMNLNSVNVDAKLSSIKLEANYRKEFIDE